MKIRKPRNYWQNKENCKIETLKYKTKSDFKTKSAGAYDACLNNKWIDELCQHMIKIGHRYLKCVYVYEFSDNHVYVGITYNIERREHDRNKCKTDSVTKHINETGLQPKFKQITDYIDVDEAVFLEGFYVEQYLNDRWLILNKSKTGSVGKVNIWTKEKCVEVARKCKTRTEFSKESKGAYDAARRYGWLDDVYFHMEEKIKPKKYWSKEKCLSEFLKYDSKKEVKIHKPKAYYAACRNGWVNELSVHMINGRKNNGYWDIEKCIEEASKYTKRIDFRKKSASAYIIATKNNWLDEIYLSVGL